MSKVKLTLNIRHIEGKMLLYAVSGDMSDVKNTDCIYTIDCELDVSTLKKNTF